MLYSVDALIVEERFRRQFVVVGSSMSGILRLHVPSYLSKMCHEVSSLRERAVCIPCYVGKREIDVHQVVSKEVVPCGSQDAIYASFVGIASLGNGAATIVPGASQCIESQALEIIQSGVGIFGSIIVPVADNEVMRELQEPCSCLRSSVGIESLPAFISSL